MFRKLLDQGQAGDNVGVLLRGVDREGVERGQVLASRARSTPHTKFEAEAYILTKEEGGRHTPFFANYRPQFYFRTTDVTGTVELAEGTEMVMPGDNVSLKVELIAPIAMEERPALRDPRRRPHRWRRRRVEDHRLIGVCGCPRPAKKIARPAPKRAGFFCIKDRVCGPITEYCGRWKRQLRRISRYNPRSIRQGAQEGWKYCFE